MAGYVPPARNRRRAGSLRAARRLVFLLHDFPEFWWAWRRRIGPLAAAGLRIVAPDLRGYNLSTKPRGVAAYAALARYLASHPLRLSYFAAFQIPLVPEAMLRVGNFAALARAMHTIARSGSFTATDLARYRVAWAQPGALTAMLNWYRAALRHRPRYDERRIATPIRIIWGDRDIALDAPLAEAGQALCEQAEVFHLPDATHWLHHDQPEEVNRLLLDFLAA